MLMKKVVCRLSRVDYDIAVGVSGSTAKDSALSELSHSTEPMPYNNSDEFAVFSSFFYLFIYLFKPRYLLL